MSGRKRHCHGRRGAITAATAVFIPVLLGFAALAVDIGFHCVVRAQLQNAADAAALAGAGAYFSDFALAGDEIGLENLVRTRACETGALNESVGQPTIFEPHHISVGIHDWDAPTSPLGRVGRWNAIEATAHRTRDSVNGPVPYFFAQIFGLREGELRATARAAMNDRVDSYRFSETADFLPFTINDDLYNTLSRTGADAWSHNGQEVIPFSDGVPEVKLFPWRASEESFGNHGNGNFGTLQIGIGLGTSELRDQIREGVSAEQMAAAFGTPELRFSTADGTPVSYPAGGNPGLSNGMKDAIADRLGDIVGFFVHKQVVDSGSNATFEVVGVRFGRIVEVSLTGSLTKRTLTIQPIAYTSEGVVTSTHGRSTEGQVGRVVLVR